MSYKNMMTIDYSSTNSATHTTTVLWNMMQDNLALSISRPILQSDYYPTVASLEDRDRGQGGPLVLA